MILFTADWHIKLGQKNVPKEWALNRYKDFFQQIEEISKNCTLHIIGGDIFDRVPTLEELALFYTFVKQVKIPTIIFDGNHEATKKNYTFFSYLKEVTESLNENVEIYTEGIELNNFGILPYNELHTKDSIEKFERVKVLFTHVRGEIPPHVKPEVDLSRFSKFEIVFAGDLHAHSNTQLNIVYPGSPMTTSFHRSEVKTGYLLIDENTWEWEWKEFKLPQLIRKTVSSLEEMLPTEYHHTIYEIEGDLSSLSGIKNSELLDKKVIKRSSETSLILNKEMSIRDELAEYLIYILEIDEDKVKDIIGVFNDYT